MTYYDSEDTSSNIMSQPLHHQEYVHIWPLVLHKLLASVQHVAGSAAIQEAKTAAWQKLFSGYDGFNPYWAMSIWIIIPNRDDNKNCLNMFETTKSGLGTLHTWRLTTPQATKLATIRTELHCNSGCFQRETGCFAGQRSESLSRMGFSRLELPFDSLWVIIETAAFSCKALKAFKWLRAWQVSQGVRGVKKTKERFEVSSQAYQGAYP